VERFSMSQVTTLGWPFERDLEAYAAAGVPAVGVSVEKLAQYGVARAARAIRAAGLGVSCLCATGPFPLGDPAACRTALDAARRHLDAAATLGAESLVVVPGADPALAWEEAAARARGLLEALLPAAAKTRVRLAVEPVGQLRVDLGFLHTFADALDFVDAIGSPWLGVVCEVQVAWIERGLYANLAARTDRIALVQVSDFKVGTRQAADRVVIGDGDVPLGRICRALAAAGYAGWYDIELLGPAIEAEGYEAVVPRAVARFRALWT
jgi:sugar phosphate isomerase/epimerase